MTAPVQPDTRTELATLLRSRIPLVLIETRDEPRALALLASLAVKLQEKSHTPVFQWTVTDGLRRIDVDLGGAQRHNSDPAEVLKSIRATDKTGIYVLLDFHPFLNDPIHVRLLKDICQGHEKTPRTLVLISHELSLPRELEHFVARFQLAFPDRAERHGIVEKVATEWARTSGSRVRTDRKALELLIENLGGLSTVDTERLARQAIFDDGALQASDLPALMQAKYALLNRSGVLSFEYDTAKFADLGGMARLKEWLRQRRSAFDGSAPQFDPPKGLLLLGVQGCGKSVAARAAAGIYGVPLLRLDFAALHNKYLGESERNLRDTLATADVMSPCVLWIDEIEKGIANGEGDSGTSRRVLGTFLTWLAEKKSRVFIIATANDISSLPPELIRKGRFDEIFFVDLPKAAVRADILRIHAGKRSLTLSNEHVEKLAAACEGFSGAEIEQAVVSALYAAHAANSTVSASHILSELRSTRPLSVVMAERIAELRAWAAERTVAAD
ncbi:MAG TPA: AAA family ATPase [Povalibacter sp.]|uniref:AAA family ATPase n=1 Tax=Povalibacter sp. TaxID=1962978 RepID=UPI002C075143|nr:AAA family ATPase [Povalibacter sp.]HMN44512.1 AAA family ATPase [Povalibacter sp.]